MTIRREDLNTTNLFQIEDENLKTLEIQLSGKYDKIYLKNHCLKSFCGELQPRLLVKTIQDKKLDNVKLV